MKGSKTMSDQSPKQEVNLPPSPGRGTHSFLSSSISMSRPPTVIAYRTARGLAPCTTQQTSKHARLGERESSGETNLRLPLPERVETHRPDHLVVLRLPEVMVVALWGGGHGLNERLAKVSLQRGEAEFLQMCPDLKPFQVGGSSSG